MYITLSTGHLARTSGADVSDATIQTLQPWIQAATESISNFAAESAMKRYTVRIPGYRITVTASSVWAAIEQVLERFPAPRSCSATLFA